MTEYWHAYVFRLGLLSNMQSLGHPSDRCDIWGCRLNCMIHRCDFLLGTELWISHEKGCRAAFFGHRYLQQLGGWPSMPNGWHVWVCGLCKNWDVFSFQELIAIKRWAFAHSSRLQQRTAVRSRPWWGRWERRWASLRQFLTVCAEILWLCKPIAATAVWVAGLTQSCRWRSQMCTNHAV